MMRVRAKAPPAKLDASLSVSLWRRLFAGELRALPWSEREWTTEVEERLPVTLVGGGLGDRRSLQGSEEQKKSNPYSWKLNPFKMLKNQFYSA